MQVVAQNEQGKVEVDIKKMLCIQQKKSMLATMKFLAWLKKDFVLVASVVLALVSLLMVRLVCYVLFHRETCTSQIPFVFPQH